MAIRIHRSTETWIVSFFISGHGTSFFRDFSKLTEHLMFDKNEEFSKARKSEYHLRGISSKNGTFSDFFWGPPRFVEKRGLKLV